jgi:hypothetical protein
MAGIRATKNSLKSRITPQNVSVDLNSKSIGTSSATRRSVSVSSMSRLSNTSEENLARQFDLLNGKIDRLLETQNKLEKTVENLQGTIQRLEESNKSLLNSNAELKNENLVLADKLKSTETALSAAIDDLEIIDQRSLNNTVEILGVPSDITKDGILDYVLDYSKTIKCNIEEKDIDNIYLKSNRGRNNTNVCRIILRFITLRKRMDFYYSSRKFRYERKSTPGDAGNHLIKVVDALTYNKRSVFLEIIEQRKQHKDVLKNVFINDGNIFVRRFGSKAAEPVKNMEFVSILFDNVSVAE